VQVDALAVRLRARSQMEAADLGVGLCQRAAQSVYACFAVAALPVALLAIGSSEIAPALPIVVIWFAKPWLDRTILFVLSRAAFGQQTSLTDLWRAQRDVWWRQLPFTWSVRRLSPWRSFTQPVFQLEGGTILEANARVKQIRGGHAMSALMITHAFSMTEAALTLSLLSLVLWLAPSGTVPAMSEMLTGTLPRILAIAVPTAYGIAVFFVEPFYVAAGFAMYLNRRAELEAWDIEQEFRRAFVH
jgi:hypothetical protein